MVVVVVLECGRKLVDSSAMSLGVDILVPLDVFGIAEAEGCRAVTITDNTCTSTCGTIADDRAFSQFV